MITLYNKDGKAVNCDNQQVAQLKKAGYSTKAPTVAKEPVKQPVKAQVKTSEEKTGTAKKTK